MHSHCLTAGTLETLENAELLNMQCRENFPQDTCVFALRQGLQFRFTKFPTLLKHVCKLALQV